MRKAICFFQYRRLGKKRTTNFFGGLEMLRSNENKKWCGIIVVIVCLAMVGVVRADWLEKQKLLASDGVTNDQFGKSVSVSGEYAIVGADYDDSSTGSAYIFKHDGTSWVQQTKLTASDRSANDRFGYSAFISGDFAIVGAPHDDDNGYWSGSAYVFKRDGENWTQEAKLIPSDGSNGDEFGISVSISTDYAIVGAYRDNDNGSDSGSAYIFKRDGSNWAQQAKLTASDAAANDYFGKPVSISGDYVIVAANGDDDDGDRSGSAYIFKRDGTGWIQQAKLTASDAAAGDLFAESVSISGNYAIVGAYLDDDKGTNSGSAYIFKRNGTDWIEEAKLIASDGAADDSFGVSVSINGDYAVVGAWMNDTYGMDSGSAYIFKWDGTSWVQQQKLIVSDGESGDLLGHSVSVSGNHAIVGAFEDDDKGTNSGSAYIFVLEPADPVAYYPFDGDYNDASGNNYDANNYNTNFTIDRCGNSDSACLFDSFMDRIELPHEVLDNSNDFTVFARVKLSSLGDQIHTIVSGANPSHDNEVLLFYHRHLNDIGISVLNSTGWANVSLPINEWISIAWVRHGDTGTSEIYLNVNNGPYTISGPSGPVNVSPGGLWLGLDQDSVGGGWQSEDQFYGIMDDIYIYNRALSACEIEELMGACPVTKVFIDIKPGSYPNAINLGSHGLIPVAIFSEADFDATTVDPNTVELARARVVKRGKGKFMAHEDDVDGDGLVDLVVQVATDDLDPSLLVTVEEDGVTYIYAVLTGSTYGGEAIVGEDEITIVPDK